MDEEPWRRNHREGIMEEESCMRNHEEGTLEKESWRRKESWRKTHGGGLVEEAPREHSGKPLGTSLVAGVAWGDHGLLCAKQ